MKSIKVPWFETRIRDEGESRSDGLNVVNLEGEWAQMEGTHIRIWYLIGTLSVGGTERTLVDLANGLDEDVFDVTIWTIAEPGPLADDVSDHVSLRSLDAAGKFDVMAPLRFVSELRDASPDILQSFLYYDNTLATLAGVFGGETTVVTGVRAAPTDPNRSRGIVRRGTVRLADHIVSNSEAGVEFVSGYGANRGRISVVRNGRDLKAYRNGNATAELRRSLEIPERKDLTVVGTVGRLIERKGHYDLLDAWPSILSEHPGSHLLIVGDGPEHEGLETKARSLGIAETVHLPGTRDDIPEVLDLLDVFAFPSRFEGLPGALLEAMAAGLPVVATAVDGNTELVEHERSGLLVPARDSGSLAGAICRLLSEPQFADSLGTEASRTVDAGFSLDRMVDDFTSLYVEIATR